jgi:hypothetical protein
MRRAQQKQAYFLSADLYNTQRGGIPPVHAFVGERESVIDPKHDCADVFATDSRRARLSNLCSSGDRHRKLPQLPDQDRQGEPGDRSPRQVTPPCSPNLLRWDRPPRPHAHLHLVGLLRDRDRDDSTKRSARETPRPGAPCIPLDTDTDTDTDTPAA